MKLISLVLTSIAAFSAVAEEVSLRVMVKDDLGQPVSNAVVSVSTQKKLIFGYGSHPDHFEWTSNVTDSTGVSILKFRCLTADFSCYVASPNHYPAKNLHGRFSASENGSLEMDFLSTQTNMEFTIYRKVDPVPMFSYPSFDAPKLPGPSGVWGYDLRLGDWVRPFGKGEVSDFKLEYNLRASQTEYAAWGRIVFEGPKSGFYIRKMNGTQLMKSDYLADTNAVFASSREFSYSAIKGADKNARWQRNAEWRKLIEEDECLVMRTRVKIDDEGNIVSANYSKMYGPVVFKKRFGFGQITFNPNVNDPNLESDPAQNLNVKSRGCGLP